MGTGVTATIGVLDGGSLASQPGGYADCQRENRELDDRGGKLKPLRNDDLHDATSRCVGEHAASNVRSSYCLSESPNGRAITTELVTVFALAFGMRWPSNELHVVLTDLVWTGIFITVVFILAG